MIITFARSSTNYLRAQLNYENGAPVTGATVTGTISKTHGDVLAGLSNIPMLEVTGTSTYNYQAVIQPAQLDVDEGILYSVEVVAFFGGSEIRKRATVKITED